MKKTQETLNRIAQLEERYEQLLREINIEKANGDLATLCNLNETFDETFDSFFDEKRLRIKYEDWNHEEECVLFEKSNTDLKNELDEEDSRAYIDFFKNYIDELEEELANLKKETA